MKNKFAFIISIVSLCLLTLSCSGSLDKDDEADAFVGTWNVSVVEHVVWGASFGTLQILELCSSQRFQQTECRRAVIFGLKAKWSGMLFISKQCTLLIPQVIWTMCLARQH